MGERKNNASEFCLKKHLSWVVIEVERPGRPGGCTALPMCCLNEFEFAHQFALHTHTYVPLIAVSIHAFIHAPRWQVGTLYRKYYYFLASSFSLSFLLCHSFCCCPKLSPKIVAIHFSSLNRTQVLFEFTSSLRTIYFCRCYCCYFCFVLSSCYCCSWCCLRHKNHLTGV